MRFSLYQLLGLAFLIRIILVLYGEWQDRTMVVKYTDIDYTIYTDAARFVWQGQSPYKRDTYRYSPLLAYFLLPNVYLHGIIGKVQFILLDLWAGYLMYCMLKLQGIVQNKALWCISFWLFNPLSINISTQHSLADTVAFISVSLKKCEF